jgi:hypothetical protein
MEFKQDEESCTCIIYRKDRSHPISVTEYMSECKRGAGPWLSHPKRLLRHKAMIQCSRLAFGYTGIFDQDEAERIIDMGTAERAPVSAAAVERNQADGFDAFEAEHLPAMREAAMKGIDALTAAFGTLPKGAHKTAFWTKNGPELKKAAAESVTVIDNETGEVVNG